MAVESLLGSRMRLEVVEKCLWSESHAPQSNGGFRGQTIFQPLLVSCRRLIQVSRAVFIEVVYLMDSQMQRLQQALRHASVPSQTPTTCSCL